MQVSVDYLNSEMNHDFKSLVDKKAAMESTPSVRAYLALLDEIKAKKVEIGNDMLALYRNFGIQSIHGEVATAYIKTTHEIFSDRLTASQIVGMLYLNPAILKISDKDIRECIDLAKRAQSNGDCSEGVMAILGIDLEKIRKPAEHSAVVKMR